MRVRKSRVRSWFSILYAIDAHTLRSAWRLKLLNSPTYFQLFHCHFSFLDGINCRVGKGENFLFSFGEGKSFTKYLRNHSFVRANDLYLKDILDWYEPLTLYWICKARKRREQLILIVHFQFKPIRLKFSVLSFFKTCYHCAVRFLFMS